MSEDFKLALKTNDDFDWEGYFKMPQVVALPIAGGAVWTMQLRRTESSPMTDATFSSTDGGIVKLFENTTEHAVLLKFLKSQNVIRHLLGEYAANLLLVVNGKKYNIGQGTIEITHGVTRF